MTGKNNAVRERRKFNNHALFIDGPEPAPAPRRSWWVAQPREGFTATAQKEVRPNGKTVNLWGAWEPR
jgi:hypothetical protein